MAAFHGDETAPFFGFGAPAAFFSCMWAGYGTAKSGVGVVLPASLQAWQSGSLVMLVSGLFASNWQDVSNIHQVPDQQVGFLYLRYMADSKTLWNWCEPYITDNEGQALDVKSLRLLGLMH